MENKSTPFKLKFNHKIDITLTFIDFFKKIYTTPDGKLFLKQRNVVVKYDFYSIIELRVKVGINNHVTLFSF